MVLCAGANRLCAWAARSGHLPVLQWVRTVSVTGTLSANGAATPYLGWDAETAIFEAAWWGEIPTLRWLHSEYPEGFEDGFILTSAATSAQGVEVLEFLRNECGCPVAEGAVRGAARSTTWRLPKLKWLYTQVCLQAQLGISWADHVHTKSKGSTRLMFSSLLVFA